MKAEVDPKLGVAPSPRLVGAGQKVPKGGGRAMVGKPYTVGGKRYYPKHEPGYEKVGLASWYGDAFHGRKTANGEIFDSTHLSAAHPTMPLPSYARVTALDTGRSVMVRVNDRGPFHSNRILDMSRRTADVLGIRAAGIAKVKVEYIGPAPKDGDDTPYLVASYRGPGELPAEGPSETMVASADTANLPGVETVAAAPAAVTRSVMTTIFRRADTEVPAKAAPAAPAEVPATAAAEPVMVASAAPVAQPVDGEAGAYPPVGPAADPTALPPVRPVFTEEVYVMVAGLDPAEAYFAGTPTMVASVSPVDPASVTAVGYTPESFKVGPQPSAEPGQPGTPGPRNSYAADRFDAAYAALDGMGEGVPLADLASELAALAGPAADGPSIDVGLFANPDNAERIAIALAAVGTVERDVVAIDGRNLERVRITALKVSPEAAVAAAERAGADGARIRN